MAIKHLRILLLGLVTVLLALLAVSPAPLSADHDKLSLTPVSDLPLAAVGLRRHTRSP